MLNKSNQKGAILTFNQSSLPEVDKESQLSCQQMIVNPKIKLVSKPTLINSNLPVTNNLNSFALNSSEKNQKITPNQEHFNKGEDNEQNENRRLLSWSLLTANILAILLSSAQNCYIIYAEPSDLIGYVYGSILLFDLIVCLYTSYYLSETGWEFLNLYLLVDNMLVVLVAASIGFVSFNEFRANGEWYWTVVTVAFPLDFFLLVGNFRLLMVKGQWNKGKIILYKIVLLGCILLFFETGVYFITVDYSYTNNSNSKFDGQIKQLMLLNVFGTFSLIIEMYSKMTDLDHTGELQASYQLKQFNDEEMANNVIEFSEFIKLGSACENIKERGIKFVDGNEKH